MPQNHTTRILIIRFSSIGDIVLTTPVVRALKNQLEGDVEIHYLTKNSFASILESNPYIDVIHAINDKVSEAVKELQKFPFDYIIDLHNNLRSKQVKRSLKTFAFTLDKRNIAKWLYVQTKHEVLPIGHIVERNLETVHALGIEDDGLGLDFIIPVNEAVNLASFPSEFQNGFVSYAIGGTTPGKVLPIDRIIQLCQKIDRPIMLLGGPDDARTGDEIEEACGRKVYNACGKFSLHQSASLLDQSAVVIAHDTGLMHIAAALKKRVISLWFATTPEIGMSPWRPGKGSVMVEADCKKRPTSKLGNRGYKDGCVFNIDLNLITDLVNRS